MVGGAGDYAGAMPVTKAVDAALLLFGTRVRMMSEIALQWRDAKAIFPQTNRHYIMPNILEG